LRTVLAHAPSLAERRPQESPRRWNKRNALWARA